MRPRGLRARLDDVVAWIGEEDLARFLHQLADDFRGWQGERIWKTHDDDLALRAVLASGGHVNVTWTLRPWRKSAFDRWEATVTTQLEAGEQMAALAADIRYFLHQDDRGPGATPGRTNCVGAPTNSPDPPPWS